jgi:hypothetical protein
MLYAPFTQYLGILLLLFIQQMKAVGKAATEQEFSTELDTAHDLFRTAAAGGYEIGAQSVGVTVTEDAAALSTSVFAHQQIQALDAFADEIRNPEPGAAPLTPKDIEKRVGLYVNAIKSQFWDAVVDHAAVGTAGKGALIRWNLGPTDHCVSCAKMAAAGPMTPEAYKATGLYPQSYALACHGFNCQCYLTTEAPGNATMSDVSGEARDADGRWTAVTEKTPTASQKSILASLSAKYVGAEIQRYSEEHNEPLLAKGVGGLSLRDNEPVDVIIHAKDKTGKMVLAHGVELKTLVDNKSSKITQNKTAIANKKAWSDRNGAPHHTVVFDDRNVFNAGGHGVHDDSKRQIYYKAGSGSFRIASMTKVKDMAHLKQLIGVK